MKEISQPSSGPDVESATGWGRLGTAALLGSVFTLPVGVDAGVVYSGVQNLTATLAPGDRVASVGTANGSRDETLLLDLDGNLVNDFELRLVQFRNVGVGRGGVAFNGLVPDNGVAAVEGGFPVRVTSSNIGASVADWKRSKILHYFSDRVGTYGFAANSPFILGVRFKDGADTHYGWIRLLIESGSEGFPVSVKAVDWAWNDVAGALTHIEPVPEANSGLVLLAAGGTGLAAWRLRRRQAPVAGSGSERN